MVITGRIFDIVVLNEKVAQIVLKKKIADKIVPVAICVFGYWKDKAIKEMKLKPKDKIKGNVYLKSKIYNGKYYTDVYFKEVLLIEDAVVMKKPESGLFQTDEGLVDTETGELIDNQD